MTLAHSNLHESQEQRNSVAFKDARSGFWSRSDLVRCPNQEAFKCSNVFVLWHFYLLTHRLHWSMMCQWLLRQGKKIDNNFRYIKIILIRKIFLLRLFIARWTCLGCKGIWGCSGMEGRRGAEELGNRWAPSIATYLMRKLAFLPPQSEPRCFRLLTVL